MPKTHLIYPAEFPSQQSANAIPDSPSCNNLRFKQFRPAFNVILSQE
jgi:hypothetical protein